MPLDPSIFNAVGRFPSVDDITAQRGAANISRLHALLMGNELENAPLHRQQLELAVAQGQIGNEKARMLIDLLRGGDGSGSAAPQMPPMAAPAPAPSQWSPGGAQGPALPADAPPVSLPVPNTPQPPPQGAVGPMPPPVNAGPPRYMGQTAENWGRIHALGGPDMLATVKALAEGVVQPPGSQVKDMRTGEVSTVPTLDRGQEMITGPDGRRYIRNIDGSVQAAAESAGAISGAQERAKAGYTPLDPKFVGSDLKPVGGTVASYVGAGAPQGASPGAAPLTASPMDEVPAGGNAPSPTGRGPQNSQAAVLADMAKNGVSPANASVNGAPMLGGAQEMLDAAKRGGPEAMQRFLATMLPKLSGDTRAQMGLLADAQTPIGTPIHSMGPAPAGNAQAAPGGSPGLAGPAQIAGATEEAQKVQTRHDAYETSLNSKVEEAFNLQRRNADILANMKQFQAGLAGGHLRADLASNLANMFPDSPRVQEAAGALVGGGPGAAAAAQTFNNLVAGAMVTNAIQVLDKQGRLTNAVTQQLKAAAESASTDPGALTRIMAIQDRYGDQDLAEQQALKEARLNHTFHPETWQAEWAKQRRAMMSDPDSVFAPVSAAPPPGVSPRGQSVTSPQGRRFTLVPE